MGGQGGQTSGAPREPRARRGSGGNCQFGGEGGALEEAAFLQNVNCPN